MKNFLTKYFGYLGLVIYFILAFVARIPVALFLAIFITFVLLILDPIIGRDLTPHWVNRLYDWYRGE